MAVERNPRTAAFLNQTAPREYLRLGRASWLKKADEALYGAKHLGRNLVRLSGEPPPQPGQSRSPARKEAVAGVLSDGQREELRLDILRRGGALCPVDKIPLTVHDVTTLADLGKSFVVYCGGCGFQADLPGPRRQ